MKAETRQRLMYAGRMGLGILLMAYLLVKIDWRSMAGIFSGISIFYLVVLIGLSFVLIWISCVKWSLFLSSKGRKVPIMNLMSLYMVGYFFNNFLPSQYGGDLVRSYELGRDIDSQVTSFGSVFLERYTGLVALVLVSTAAALLMPDLVATAKIGPPFIAAWAGLLVSLWLIADPRPVAYLSSRFYGGKLERPARAFDKLHNEVRQAGESPSLIAWVMALSIFFHWLTVVNTYVALLAIRVKVDFTPLMLVVPIILMVSAIPVTVNSIGLFEGAFVFFLGPLGVGGAEALSIALILRIKAIIMALLGGVVYFSRTRRNR